MELSNFFKTLKKHRITLGLVPVIAIIITYFLVRNQADVYSSQAKLATGIVDQTQKVFGDQTDAQDSKINQEFANLTEMLQSKKVMDQVAYVLMIHDLTSAAPYRKPSKLFNQLNTDAKAHAVKVFKDLYNRRESLVLTDPDQSGLSALIGSMKYDDDGLGKTMNVYRIQNSDYISVSYDSENPVLSVTVVNTLCNEFISYYTSLVKDNQKKAVDFLGALLNAKNDTLNKRMAALKAYKIKNHVLNLNEKAKSIYSQISDFETRREDMEKTIRSTQGAIDDIDKKFDPSDRKYLEGSQIAISQQLVSTQKQLQDANEEYVQNNFDPQIKQHIDSLSGVVTSQLGKLSDKYVLNPLTSKQNLVDQKLNLQVQNELAKNSIGTTNTELQRLYNEFDSLVPHEGTIQALESAVTVASQEYLEILQKYNQTNMGSSASPVHLKVIEPAEPGAAQPSKKMLLVIISGVIGFIFCIIIFFLLFIFDSTIKSARELANITKLPVLGHVNFLDGKSIDLHAIWENASTNTETKQLRNLMQSLRFEVTKELGDEKVLLINSVKKAEGKTFTAINLAYAFSSVNKKVLVIDGNFSNPGITDFTKTKVYVEDFLKAKGDGSLSAGGSKITFLGNKGNDNSILELGSEAAIAEKFAALKKLFDVIIIEASALDTLNRSKEWTGFSDKILTVFEAGNSVDENYKQKMEYLKGTGKFSGWVLNMVQGDKPVVEHE